MDEKKLESLKVAITSIEKRFGKGSLMKLGEHETAKIDVIPTGSLSIDYAIGVCGIPRGRVTEIYGPESSGKTTLALHCVANAQKEGGIAAFVDAEHALDVEYAKNLGVDVDNLLISQPDSGEQALEIIDTLVRSNAVDIIVLDSVAALVPQAEIEGDMGDSHMGLQARLMSQALRKLTGAISKTNTAIIFLNQIRSKIGVMFGNPETTTGGNALKFYASVRIDIRKINNIKQGQDIVGSRTKVKIVKNKVAPPFKEAEVDIIYGKGIDYIGDALDLAVNHDIIEKSGSWFAYQNQRLGQGRDNARDFLKDNPELLKTLINEIKSKLNCHTQKKEDDTD
ncbi:MAG TPA: recombinase RecA [Desulfurella acetivorans]|uniref:Protein RecA n=1 Tax=Desulfurella acetivorans TaxID=33002 RepID=A0A7C6A6I1_DESAE|nr:recombinase RecA [Desulfurella acetivorans]